MRWLFYLGPGAGRGKICHRGKREKPEGHREKNFKKAQSGTGTEAQRRGNRPTADGIFIKGEKNKKSLKFGRFCGIEVFGKEREKRKDKNCLSADT